MNFIYVIYDSITFEVKEIFNNESDCISVYRDKYDCNNPLLDDCYYSSRFDWRGINLKYILKEIS